ncbi:cocaine- and amphetamine-regulated transcript 2 [Lycodopsis pacificus]
MSHPVIGGHSEPVHVTPVTLSEAESCITWARAVLLAALLSALCPTGSTEAERDVQDYGSSNRLVTLHEVLEKLQTKRINPWEKKYEQVPSWL